MIALRCVYDFYLISKYAAKIKNHFHYGNENLESFKKERVDKVIHNALKTNFYKDYFKKYNLNKTVISIHDFPIISKTHLRNSIKAFSLNNSFIPKTISNTGGSTGSPLSFFTDLNCRLNEFSHQLFFYKEIGFKRFDKIYSFGGVSISEIKISKNIFWKKKIIGFPFGKVIFSAELLNEKNVSYYYAKILANKPHFLRGYPSALIILANYIKKNNISINFIKGVLLTSEMISESNVLLIGKYLNCVVVPQYGQGENSVFGFTYPNSLKYFCSPFYSITEIINPETGLHVNKRELGEIVVTSLSNLYQPLIRYKTGDMAIYGGEKNGFVILEKLYGRQQDFIYDLNSKKILLVGLIFGSHVEAFNHINDWQFIQNVVGELFINIHPSKSWSSKSHEKMILNLFKNQQLTPKIVYDKKFIKTKIGKRKFLIKNIKIE